MIMELTCSALLFDLDGVLIDSSAVIRRHWQKWARLHKIPFERIMSVAHGRTSTEIIRIVAPQMDAEAEGRQREEEEGRDTDGLKAYPAARQLLLSIPDGHWAIVTSGKPQTAFTRLKFGRLPIPPVLVTADDVERGKPAPDPYLSGAQRLGVAASRCVVVEDSPAGIEAAQAAGMKVIAIATTHSLHSLNAADFVLRKISDLTLDRMGEQLRLHVKPIKYTENKNSRRGSPDGKK